MNFFYEAVDTNGKTIVGKLDANSENEVRQRLTTHGYRPVSVAPNPLVAGNPPANSVMGTAVNARAGQSGAVGTMPATVHRPARPTTASSTGGVMLTGSAAQRVSQRKPAKPAPGSPAGATPGVGNVSKLGGVSTKDQMFFFQQFATLVKSGISLYSALEDLGKRTRNQNLVKTVREMAEQARTGGRISDVMERYPRIYPGHVVGTVRAGELGGFLEIALSEIALNYEQNIALYRGSWLPKAMATQAFFLLPFVQPLFPTLFPMADFKTYLILVFLRNLPICLALYGVLLLAIAQLQLPQHRYLRDSWALRLPPFGDLQRQAALAAFVRMLRRLYQAGVSPILAWEGAMNTASNVVIRERLASAYTLMQQGASLPDAFAATGLFGDSIEQTIATGHMAGEVVEALDRAATYYQERVSEAVTRSRMTMMRYGLLAMLVFGGAATIWMEMTYFKGIFEYVDKFFGTND